MSQDHYAIDAISDHYADDPAALDALRLELDKRLFHYGDHFLNPTEGNAPARPMRSRIKSLCFLAWALGTWILRKFLPRSFTSSAPAVVSNAYFNLSEALASRGQCVIRSPWELHLSQLNFGNAGIAHHCSRFRDWLHASSFSDLLAPDARVRINDFSERLSSYFAVSGTRALIVPNDMNIFENLAIQACRRAGVRTMVALHGLPGRYNRFDDNRADFLLVWGEAIKRNYVRAGVPETKILVTGHPRYDGKPPARLRNTLDSVLVLAQSVPGGQFSDKFRSFHRQGMIAYLYQVQSALKSRGILQARLRPHPSDNPDWFKKFIDNGFYTLDTRPLAQALADSSLVVGPVSTVFLEALQSGVNYLVYEPGTPEVDTVGLERIPPFDRSDPRLTVCYTVPELKDALAILRPVDTSILRDYLGSGLDLEPVIRLIQDPPRPALSH